MAHVTPDSWISRWADHCTEGYECPFEELFIHGWGDHARQLVEIVGLRQGGERSARVSLDRIRQIALDHLRSRHGITDLFEASVEHSGHAVAIAAVACLMD